MATKRASLILSVDGGAKYKQDLNNATKETRLYKAELEAVQETYKDNANSIEALEEKQKTLLKIQQSYKKQLDAAKAGHQNAVKEYEKQSAAVDELSEKLEAAKKKLDDYQKSGGSDSNVSRSLEKDVSDISTALEKQRLNLAKAEGKVTDWQKAQIKAAKDLANVDKELVKNDKYLDEAAKSADGCAKSIDKFGNEAKESAGEIGEMTDKSSGMMDVLKGMVGADLLTSGLHTIADGAKEAIEYVIGVGSEFEAGMSKVQALSGATGKELEALKEKAKELGASTQFSASEVAEAMSNMALAGWETSDILSGIDGVLALAASGQMDLANASDAVAGYLAAFNMEAKDAAHLSDVMATAQAKSKTTADQLAEAYSTSATNLTGYGQDLETTTALIEAMASVNDTGSAAGTKLNAVMAQIVQKMEDGSIAIGDTRVAVQDANGDFRSMIDIIGDIEQATDGMAEADRAAALQKTFNRTALSGLNELLSVGSEQLKTYQSDLEHCDGAASTMASTMNDNLKGDLKEFDSAVEGLGIAAYNYFEGPLRGAVGILTNAVNGLTGLLDNPQDKFDLMVDDLEDANDRIENVMKGVDEEYATAEQDANRVVMLVEQLKRLNEEQQAGEGTETDALARKMQMQAIIDQLGDSIPEITKAWNEETGELNLSNQELSTMVENYKNLAIQQAAMHAMQEVTNALIEANIALEEGQANSTILEQRKEGIEKLQTAWQNFNAEYLNTDGQYKRTDALMLEKKQMVLLDDALSKNIITQEEYNDLVKNTGDVLKLENGVNMLTTAYQEADEQLKDQNGELEKLQKNVDDAKTTYDSYGDIVANATDRINKSTESAGEAMEDATESVVTFSLQSKEATEGVAEGYDEIGESAEETAETVDESAEAMQAAIEAERQAAEEAAKAQIEANKEAAKSQSELAEITRQESERVRNALADIREEARKTVETDFFAEFNGGTDESVDTMLQRAKDNIEALQTYQDNLKEVSSHVGKEIAPEFLSYLESLGTGGANMLAQISKTFEQDGGAEKVKQWSDAYLETINIQDETADILADDRIMLENGLKELGSTPADFDELRTNIDIAVQNSLQGWDALTEGTQQKLYDTVAICEQLGIQIPSGLSDGIISGSASPEEALAQLEASIQGRFEGLLADAQAQGIDITDSISEGLNEGGTALIEAYAELLALITQSETDADEAMNTKGETVGKEFGSGVGSATAEAETGAQSLSDAATTTLTDNQSEFETAGSGAGEQYASGIDSTESTVTASAKTLASAAAAAMKANQNEFRNVGLNASYGVAYGIYDGASAAYAAARTVAQGVVNIMQQALDINSPSRVIRDQVGKQIPAGLALGIKANESLAVSAAQDLSEKVLTASVEWVNDQRKYKELSARDEATYWKEITKTVEKGTDEYTEAMQKYSEANARATCEASKLQQETLKQASKNFGVSRTKTTGSGDNKKTVQKSVDDYYGEIYQAAQQYFSNMKAVQDVSAEQERRYWQTVSNTLRAGTDAWYDAQAKIRDLSKKIAQNQKTYQEEARKVAEQQARAQNEARQKIVSDAEDNLRKTKILNDVSLKDEINYWERILYSLTQYSDQWYDVYEKIRDLKSQSQAALVSEGEETLRRRKLLNNVSLKEEQAYWEYLLYQLEKYSDEWFDVYEKVLDVREQVKDAQKEANETAKQEAAEKIKIQQDNQNKLLSDWKIYYKVSAKAEMEYWDKARKQWRLGTDERKEADSNYIQAKENYYNELRRLDEKYQDDLADVQSKMQDKIDDLTKTYKDAVKSREESILSSMNLFEAWDSEGISGKELIENLETQVEGLERYTVVLEKLKARNVLDAGLIEELTEMGPDAGANIAALASMTTSELKKYNDLYLQRQELAHQQALSDNKTLLEETKRGIKEAQQEATVDLKELNRTLQEELSVISESLHFQLAGLLDTIGNFGTYVFKGSAATMGGQYKNALRDNLNMTAGEIVDTVEAKLETLETSLPDVGDRALTALMASMSDREKIKASTDSLIETIKEELGTADFTTAFADVPTVDLSGMSRTLNYSEQSTVNVDNTEIVNALNSAVRTIESMVSALEGATVVLDTGETVGALQYAMSQAQADEYLTYNRGRL